MFHCWAGNKSTGRKILGCTAGQKFNPLPVDEKYWVALTEILSTGTKYYGRTFGREFYSLGEKYYVVLLEQNVI